MTMEWDSKSKTLMIALVILLPLYISLAFISIETLASLIYQAVDLGDLKMIHTFEHMIL